ncbi:hypothetical protein D0868_08011 [Hortaea werneckii]|uniref:AAA+ ATPase domain-containing protein n=1 Tax=Hortaea werneckii TaxID=91943 RepID=A0A3M6YHB5_HORWE|nr:hypothetical protein D0868_08011 [Hortaea werneckii]
MAPIATGMRSPQMNGNGASPPPMSPSSAKANRRSMPSAGFKPSRMSSAGFSGFGGSRSQGSQKLPIIEDTGVALKRKSMSELGAGVYQTIEDTSFVNLVSWIRQERLTSLPHKGSTWDTVLIRALYFADHLHGFENAVQGFASGSNAAAQLGYGHAKLLLELGHQNSDALDKAFGFFYKCSLMVSCLLDRSELLTVTSETREQLCMMYTDLLTLVVEVAIRFYKTVHGMMSSQTTSLDMYEVFGSTIETFRLRRSKTSDAIWNHQIESDSMDTEDALTIEVLNNWLRPQDRVLDLLGTDHTTFADQQAEFTCIWFQEELVNFVKGSNECLLLNGPAGSGKTTLAGSIIERLQRPVARKNFSTIFCSIGSVPSEANTLHVVKTLLYQLLGLRVGNMYLYHALARAYEYARQTADPKGYEDHLWNALTDALQHPLEHANDTVIVVDGVDEVQGGQQAGQSLLERLTRVIGRSKRTKIIALSQSLQLPSSARGSQRTISPEDTRDDIHAVAIRALAHSPHFTSKPGPEQETVIAHINDTAKGSFLWATLVCEVLKVEQSPDTFSKVLQSLKSSDQPSIPELVTRLLSILQPSKETVQLLSFIVGAARPLTYDEIDCLFSVDVEKNSSSEKRPDVHGLVTAVRPLLSVSNDIVRPRHNIVQTSLQTVIDQGKVQSGIKDRPLDSLLRPLLYAKTTLTDKGEPTLDNTDQSYPAKLFPRYPLLEYVVRYWPYHLRQTSIAPSNTTEPKPSPELQKVFPDSTIMPVLEWLCWDDQFPGSQEVELHVLVSRIRKNVFTEDHPTVLQSYINVATYFEPMGNDREASKYYFFATTIGQKVLSHFHPVTVDCATRFLALTEPMTVTSRTEVMTQREKVLLVLISAYERQFGVTSELVIETRQMLADLYMMIHEQDRATQIMQVIHGASVEKHGSDSDQVRDLSDSLRVQLGKGKKDQDMGTIGNLFIDDEEEETGVVFDLDRVSALLRDAELHVQQNKTLEAEQTYVELWQQISERCRTTLSTEWHEKKLQTVNAYSKFLKQQKRETETSAILTCVAEEYRHHELSYSEQIVSKLTEAAHTLKSVGQHNAALSIYRQASSYFKSTKKEQSRSFSQIEEEIAVTSNEVLKSATSQKNLTQNTNTVSESSLREIFRSLIANETKSIDKSTITISKQLTNQFMEERRYSEAVDIISSTLQRTWSSFFAASLHEVSMTSTFLHESLELVERLAECYLQQRMIEKVIDTYVRLFRAALTAPKEQKDLLERAKTLLVNFYDKYGYPDKSIGVFQELLAVYRRVYGPTSDVTIATLYELGSRCHAHARTHPFWIEYYQQITTALNKETDVCHANAMEATILVANSYWEERRYTEAISAFTVLWNTFTRQAKQYKQFQDTTFVQNLYDRYYQSLEATQTEWETLHRVTKEFRATCQATFGAQSSIALSATKTLARVTAQSSKHEEEALSYYEEAHKATSSSDSSSKEESSELKHTMAKMYKRRITSSSSASSETVARAASVYQEQLAESRSQYGYAHQSTLTNLREFAMLQVRQQKTEVAMRELQTAVTEINTKSMSDEKMLESAQSIAQTYQMCQKQQECVKLIQELHRQLIAKEKLKNSKFSFDLTSCSSASLVFLAGLEYNIRTDTSLTFSEILSDIIAENVYFEQFRRVMKQRSGLDKIVMAAAPLRYFLIRRNRKDMAQSLEEQIVQLFIQRDTADLTLLSQDSPRIFILGILDHLGARKTVNFVRAVILASNKSLASLIDNNKFAEAYDVANIAFIYAQYHKGYHGPKAISRGFELASYLDGRGENRCPDENLRKKLLQLSNSIIKEILKICQEQKINMAQVQLGELNQLIGLLGEQGDYETLESLLSTLWNTRDAQRSWPSQVLLNLGRRLICSRYLAGHPIKAIRLCEDIAYNLRRVHGARHPVTLETYALLAQLYTSAAQQYQKSAEKDKSSASIATDYFKKAIFVHEDVLRWLVGGSSEGAEEDDDDEDTAATILKENGVSIDEDNDGQADEAGVDRATLVKDHLGLLKLAYQRLGNWPKNYAVYERLNADVFKVFGGQLQGVEGVEKWQSKGFGAGKAESQSGLFEGVSDWEILPAQLKRQLEVAEHEEL